MAMTDKEYYENEENWGKDSYVTLQNIIDNIILTAEDDSLFRNVKQTTALIIAKRNLKDLFSDINRRKKSISFQLSPSLIFPHPRYMDKVLRISVKTSCGTLHVLKNNYNTTTQDYLQDHKYQLLYDDKGNVLRAHDKDYKYGECKPKCCKLMFTECKKDLNKFKDSWVRNEKRQNRFVFSSDLEDEIIVIEFDMGALLEMDSCKINIPNVLESTVEYLIRWKLLEGRTNVSKSDLMYFRKQYVLKKTISRNLLAEDLSINELLEQVGLKYNRL